MRCSFHGQAVSVQGTPGTRLPLSVADLSSVAVGVKSGRPGLVHSHSNCTAVNKEAPRVTPACDSSHVEMLLLDNVYEIK